MQDKKPIPGARVWIENDGSWNLLTTKPKDSGIEIGIRLSPFMIDRHSEDKRIKDPEKVLYKKDEFALHKMQDHIELYHRMSDGAYKFKFWGSFHEKEMDYFEMLDACEKYKIEFSKVFYKL